MKKERKMLPVALLQLNEGQLEWMPRNPRQWTADDVNKTAKSIAEDEDFLEDRPILVVPNGKKFVVFAGNLRSEGSKKQKLKDAPCVVYYPETEADQQAVIRRAAKDNGSFGQFDWDILANEWDAQPLQDWGIPAWPDDDNAQAAGAGEKNVEEDDFDEEKDHIAVRCKKGDIWQLGEHRLMCGDSIDLQQVKMLMGGGIADIAFFSPPYNTGGFGKNITKDNGRSKYINDGDNMTDAEYTEFLDACIKNGCEVSQYNFLNVQVLANNKQSILDALVRNRNKFADVVVWDKGRSQPAAAGNVLNSTIEFVFVFSHKANRSIGTIPFHGTLENIVRIQPERNEYSEVHNAVFPVAFVGHFIEHFAKESVLDLFGGTGTSIIAAEQLGRKCYAMEIEPYYCDVILARWEKATGKVAQKLN